MGYVARPSIAEELNDHNFLSHTQQKRTHREMPLTESKHSSTDDSLIYYSKEK